MINCVFAKSVTGGSTACRNSAKSHLQTAAPAFCYRCKVRVPVSRNMPPIVDDLPKERQMRIEEWLRDQ